MNKRTDVALITGISDDAVNNSAVVLDAHRFELGFHGKRNRLLARFLSSAVYVLENDLGLVVEDHVARRCAALTRFCVEFEILQRAVFHDEFILAVGSGLSRYEQRCCEKNKTHYNKRR